MFYLTDEKDEAFDPRMPFPVDTHGAEEAVSQSDTLTYNGKAAAGAIAIASLPYRNILNPEGDQMGSYWGNDDNFVYGTHEPNTGVQITGRNIVSVTETAGSADVVINDVDNNLELMFESLTTTVKRFIIEVEDTDGATLYGWIMGVAASGNIYTFSVFNTRVSEAAQNWVGTLASFTNTSLKSAKIYRYQSSLAFGTGTTFTKEVGFPQEYTKDWRGQIEAAQALSSGEFFVDYQRGRLIGKRADTTASETVTYQIEVAATGGATGSVATNINVDKIGGVSVIADDGAYTVGTSTGIVAFGLADETTPDSVAEGDVGAFRMTLDRRQIMAGQTLDDAAFGIGTEYVMAMGALADEASTDSVGEGDIGVPRMSLDRCLLTKVSDGTNEAAILARTTGTEQPAVTDDALVVYNVAGGAASTAALYRASTNGNGDCTVTYTSGTTLTVAGAPFTIYSEDLVYIREVDATGNTANLWVNGSGGVHMEISSNVITRSGGTAFSANGVYEVGFNGQDKGYTTGNSAFRSEEIDPLSTHYVNTSLVDTTNVSAATHYYPSSTGGTMDGYSDQSLTGKFIDANGTLTLTLEVTNDEDTSGDWNAVVFYDDELDTTVANKTVTNGTELFTLSCNVNNFRRYRWVVVASGATNTCILKERKKAL